MIDKKIKIDLKKKEGSKVKKGDLIAIINGNIKHILTGERIVLNFLSHISGIATKQINLLKKYQKNVKFVVQEKQYQILGLFKNMLLNLGGGTNHRFNLSDEYLIKDNHIASLNIEKLIELAVKKKRVKKLQLK